MDSAVLPALATQVVDVPQEAGSLVGRCRAGDESAWRALYDGHFDFAWRTARRLGLPEADADDAVQEAFQVAWAR
ncbi:MAG: hypothetical protein SFW67_30715, partial [Myxococcaceae bacterium]|nr:hypothetical protein [Myxococcaceae bacterium]